VSREETLIYIVEIEDKEGGGKAIKEYEVITFNELGGKIAGDIRGYPNIRVAGAWPKGRPNSRTIIFRR
jgi:hypothetical protein